MKLHLPKLLRVALLSVVCGVSATYAAEKAKQLEKVSPDVATYDWWDVGFAENEYGETPYLTAVTVESLTLESGDKLGVFVNGEWKSDGFGKILEQQEQYERPTKYNYTVSGVVTSDLIVTGTLTIKGTAQVSLGGQYRRERRSKPTASYTGVTDEYAGVIAEKIVVDGVAGSSAVMNLNASRIHVGDLHIKNGKVALHTTGTGAAYDQARGGNTGLFPNKNEGKQNYVSRTLLVEGGELVMGAMNGESPEDIKAHYINGFAGNAQIKQTGGKVDIYGKTALGNKVSINQQGGTMSIAKGSMMVLQSNDYAMNIEQGGKDSSLTIGAISVLKTTSNWVNGKIQTTYSNDGNGQMGICQKGEGCISLESGVTFKTNDASTASTITQTGGGAVNLTGDFSSAIFNVNQTKGTLAVGVKDTSTSTTAKLAGNTANIDGTLTITAGSSYTVSDTFAVGANADIDVAGKLVIGGDVSGVNDDGMVLKGGKLEFLATNDTTAAITLNNGALSMSSGAAVELNFTDEFLNTLVADASGNYTFNALLASGASSATAASDISMTTDCLTWTLDDDAKVALTKEDGKVYLTGTLSKVTGDITVDGQEEVINKIEGAKKLVIKTDTTISSDNTHTGGTEVHGANVVLNNAGALGDGDVSTEGVSSLQTSDGIVAELHAAIMNSGNLTLGGDYSAESGKLTSLGGSGATYICTKGVEGKNGFASSGDGLVFVESSPSNASLNVEPCTTLTVGTDKYIVSDEGNAWQLDCSTYYINEDGHEVKMSDIKDVATMMNPSNGTPDVEMKGGVLLADVDVKDLKATGGTIKAQGADIAGELSGSTSLLVAAGDNTLSGDNSYTGDTVISGAMLALDPADGANALGDSDVYLTKNEQTGEKGVLDLNRHAVSNNIYVTGCELHNASNYQGNLTVSGNLTICGTDATAKDVTLSGAGNIKPSGSETLTVDNLVVTADAMSNEQLQVATTVNESIVLYGGAVLTMKDKLTLADGTVIVLHGAYQGGDTLITLDDAGDINKTSGSVTLDNGYGAYELQGTKVVLTGIFDQTIADAMVQANWGIPTASRAFVHAVRGQRTNTGCIADGRGTAWAAVLGAYNDLDGGDINLKGAAVGADMKVGSRSSVGVAIGYLDGEVSPTGLSEVDQEGTYVALYGEHGLRKLSATSCLSADWVVAYGQTESKYRGMSWDQDSLQLNGRLSWNKQLSERLGLRVFGGLEYFTSDSDTVNGIKTGSIDNLRGELGVGVDYVAWGMPVAEKSAGMGCKRLVLHGELRYFNDLDRENPVVEMDGLRGAGENPGRSGVGIDVGATYRINDRWSTSANYSYSTMDGSTEHRLNVGASYTF